MCSGFTEHSFCCVSYTGIQRTCRRMPGGYCCDDPVTGARRTDRAGALLAMLSATTERTMHGNRQLQRIVHVALFTSVAQLLACIGEQFSHSDEICGVVVNMRQKQDKVCSQPPGPPRPPPPAASAVAAPCHTCARCCLAPVWQGALVIRCLAHLPSCPCAATSPVRFTHAQRGADHWMPLAMDSDGRDRLAPAGVPLDQDSVQ